MLHDELDDCVHTSPWGEALTSSLLIRPLPTNDLGAVDSVLVSMALARKLTITEFFFSMRSNPLQFFHSVNGVDGEAEAVRLIVNGELHGRVNVSLLFVTADMQVPMICAAVSETVNQPRVAMKVENDRPVSCEERIKVRIRQAMRMFCARL